MTGAEWAYLALGLLWALAVTIGLFVIVPSCQASLFRYRMWQLRDSIYDDVRKGQLPDNQRVRSVLGSIEGAITSSKSITISRLGLVWLLGRKSFVKFGALAREPELWRKSMSSDENKRLERYEVRLGRATLWKIFAGTPGGWIAALTLLPLVVLLIRFRTPRKPPMRYIEARITRLVEDDSMSQLTGGDESDRPVPVGFF